MLEKIKKHSVKIFVFTINILLAAIAVLVIREKDQTRLLGNLQKELSANENSLLPSFENSVSSESVSSNTSPADAPARSSPIGAGVAIPATPAPAVAFPNAPTSTVPVQVAQPSSRANTQTKTS